MESIVAYTKCPISKNSNTFEHAKLERILERDLVALSSSHSSSKNFQPPFSYQWQYPSLWIAM